MYLGQETSKNIQNNHQGTALGPGTSTVTGTHILNRYYDRVFVINLRKSVARCIRVSDELRQHGISFEIINAVDGTLRTHQQNWQTYLETPVPEEDQHPLEIKKGAKLLTRIGEWGYLLTWKVLLQRAIKEGWKRILVFEDDILLCQNFNKRVQDWFNNLLRGGRRPLVTLLGATQLPKFRGPIISPELQAYHPQITDGSFAVGLDHKVFPELLEQVLKMNAPFDSGPLRSLYQKYPEQCYVAWPHLVIADLDTSTIREAQKGKTQTMALKLQWNLQDFPKALAPNSKHKYHIGLTLYDTCLTPDQLNKALRLLLRQEDLLIDIFLLRSEHEQSELKSGNHVCVHSTPITTEIMARTLGRHYWNMRAEPHRIELFYDTSWQIDREILWVLPRLMVW